MKIYKILLLLNISFCLQILASESKEPKKEEIPGSEIPDDFMKIIQANDIELIKNYLSDKDDKNKLLDNAIKYLEILIRAINNYMPLLIPTAKESLEEYKKLLSELQNLKKQLSSP